MKYSIFDLGNGYKDICYTLKLYMFYMYTFYVSEYAVLTFFKVLKEKGNSCNFPRMVKNNPLSHKA